jgi:hypothetical protein
MRAAKSRVLSPARSLPHHPRTVRFRSSQSGRFGDARCEAASVLRFRWTLAGCVAHSAHTRMCVMLRRWARLCRARTLRGHEESWMRNTHASAIILSSQLYTCTLKSALSHMRGFLWPRDASIMAESPSRRRVHAASTHIHLATRAARAATKSHANTRTTI